MASPNSQKPGKIAIWFQAVRPFAFPASIVPVLVGTALAVSSEQLVSWILLPLVVVCSILFHAGTNLISDYSDYKKDVDKDYHTLSSSTVLIDNLLAPKQLLLGGLFMFAIACTIGIIFVAVRGLPILIIGLVGLLGGIFYTVKPVGYKYIALGEPCVFILMGPLMVIGSYFVLTGSYNNNILIISLPIGCLVAAILNANNLRDINHDMKVNVKTLANILGHSAAKFEYYTLILAAYISVVIMLFTETLFWFSLLVFLTVPIAASNILSVRKATPQNTEPLAALDIKTAKLHMAFGTLLALSILLDALT